MSNSRDPLTDVGEAGLGAAGMLLALATPFLRPFRSKWGLDRELAERDYPGDELIPRPAWCWAHGVEIDALAEAAWPWVVQLGQDRGGFYSYQILENLAGCGTVEAIGFVMDRRMLLGIKERAERTSTAAE